MKSNSSTYMFFNLITICFQRLSYHLYLTNKYILNISKSLSRFRVIFLFYLKQWFSTSRRKLLLKFILSSFVFHSNINFFSLFPSVFMQKIYMFLYCYHLIYFIQQAFLKHYNTSVLLILKNNCVRHVFHRI